MPPSRCASMQQICMLVRSSRTSAPFPPLHGSILATPHAPVAGRMHGPPKVADLEVPLQAQQQVLRLDVAVDDVLAVAVRQRPGQREDVPVRMHNVPPQRAAWSAKSPFERPCRPCHAMAPFTRMHACDGDSQSCTHPSARLCFAFTRLDAAACMLHPYMGVPAQMNNCGRATIRSCMHALSADLKCGLHRSPTLLQSSRQMWFSGQAPCTARPLLRTPG